MKGSFNSHWFSSGSWLKPIKKNRRAASKGRVGSRINPFLGYCNITIFLEYGAAPRDRCGVWLARTHSQTRRQQNLGFKGFEKLL